MVSILLDGQAHAAGQLAKATGVASSTASEHLATLVASRLVCVTREGRYRRYRIADAATAEALEALSRIGDSDRRPPILTSEQRRIRAARTCYDHLAGQLGVALLDSLTAQGWIELAVSTVTPAGVDAFAGMGIDVPHLVGGRRPLLRACLDWTERREHLAGALGAAITMMALEKVWVRRLPGSRGLGITPHGREEFRSTFHLRHPLVPSPTEDLAGYPPPDTVARSAPALSAER